MQTQHSWCWSYYIQLVLFMCWRSSAARNLKISKVRQEGLRPVGETTLQTDFKNDGVLPQMVTCFAHDRKHATV